MKLLPLLLLLVGGFSLARANPEEPRPVVQFEFVVFGLEGAAKGLAFRPRPEAAPVPLSTYGTYWSPTYTYRGPLPLVFHDPAAPDKPLATLAQLPADTRKIALVFYPETKADGRSVSILAFPHEERHLPAGHIRVLNGTGRPLAADFTGRRLTLANGLSDPIPVAQKGSLRCAWTEGDRPVLVFQQVIEFGPRDRATLVLLPPADPAYPLLRTRLLREELPPLEPAPTTPAPPAS